MSPKYIRNLHLPDKAIGWLDTASVKVEINEPRGLTSAGAYHRRDSQESRIPKDMIYRDTSDSFSDGIDLAIALSVRKKRYAPSRKACVSTRAAER
jgi:ATP-dependent Clp protease ATP-binding subunit ClpA